MVHLSKWTLGTLLAGLAAGALSIACEGGPPEPAAIEEESQEEETAASTETATEAETEMEDGRAVASLTAKSGSYLRGEAFFVEENENENEIAFGINIENVTPGAHAVHIHENGDCSAADASSAGEHWNPTNEAHGKWGEAPFHLGDIGNIEVGEDGQGTLSLTTDLWTLQSGDHSVLDKAVVVHAGADDFRTQPAGGSGEPIGCGVIEWKEPT